MGKQYVKWDITSRCNLRCRHCSVGKTYFSGRQPELPLEDKLRVVATLAAGGVQALSLLGGDPMAMKDDLFAVCAAATGSGMKLSVVTNGLLLTDRAIDCLIDCNLEHLVISVDGARPETHEFLRGANTFDAVTRNLERVVQRIQQRRSPLKVNINTVLNRRNYTEVADILDLCLALGVHVWTPLSLISTGFAEDSSGDMLLPPDAEIEAARRIAERLAAGGVEGRLELNLQFTYPLICDYLKSEHGLTLPKPRVCCSAGIGLGFVSPNGMLYPCDRIATKEYANANIDGATVRPVNLLDHSFEEAFNTDYFRNMFAFMGRDDTYQRYDPCFRCGYFHTRYCNPCPLYSLHGDVAVRSCQLVERRLGDISGFVCDEACSPCASGVNEAANSTVGATMPCDPWSAVPSKTEWLRCVQRGDELVILDPRSVRLTSLSCTGRAAWELTDGKRTVGQIVGEFESIALELRKQFPRIAETGSGESIRERVLHFFSDLNEKGLVHWVDFSGSARAEERTTVTPN